MTFENLVEETRKFERSSGFRFGDPLGFSVRLCEGLLLRGAGSAGKYLDLLGLDKLPKRVMVVGPGNGGLVTECFNRGAKRVIAVEPRFRFQSSLRGVLKLQEKAWKSKKIEDCSYRVVASWKQVQENKGFKDVDLILWPEGVSEITTPKEIFRTLDSALNPGGKLILEARLGRHKWVEKINSWQPSAHAISDMSKEIFGGPYDDMREGRGGQTSGIFTITKPGKAAAPKKTAKPAPKPKPAPKAPVKPVAAPIKVVAPSEPVKAPEAPEAAAEKPKKKKKKVSKKTKASKPKKAAKKEPAGQEEPLPPTSPAKGSEE